MKTENQKPMQVGHIPSLTWNQLDVNCGTVRGDLALNTEVETRFETLPEGISHKVLTGAQADRWLASHAPAEPAEAVVAGKVPIYHPQKFGTGLGQEYEEYLKEERTAYELFEVAPGIRPDVPVTWDVEFRNGNRASCGQIIHVGKGSSLTILMSCRSARRASGTAAVSTKIVLEEGASLFLAKAQMLGKGFVFLDDTGAALKDGAALKMVQIELGGAQVYVGTQPELVGNKSEFNAKVAYLGKGNSAIDVTYNAVQRGRKTSSLMTFDGVLDDRSRKSFRGTIDFRKGSKGSKGDEQENILLLSDDIVNKTLPIILCEEEDVEGRHGASIGQLADDILFYMASRGISRAQAEQIMVRARLGAVAREIPDEKLRGELLDYVERAFGA